MSRSVAVLRYTTPASVKRLLLLGVLIATPQADPVLLIGCFGVVFGVLIVVAGALFCKREAPARRLRRLIRAIRGPGEG